MTPSSRVLSIARTVDRALRAMIRQSAPFGGGFHHGCKRTLAINTRGTFDFGLQSGKANVGIRLRLASDPFPMLCRGPGGNAMSATITGGCLCGEIRYKCQGEPVHSFICHCTDCQQFSGSAFAAALIFSEGRLPCLKRCSDKICRYG